jgi:hypothetical protein
VPKKKPVAILSTGVKTKTFVFYNISCCAFPSIDSCKYFMLSTRLQKRHPHPLFQHLFLQCGKFCSRGFLVQSPLPLENAAAQVQFPDSIVNHNSYSRRLIRKRTNGDRAEDRVTVAELLTT